MQLDVMSIVSGIVISIVWMVRLEGKINTNMQRMILNEKEIENLKKSHYALDSKVMEDLSMIRESLARIEGIFFNGGVASKNTTSKRKK